MRDTISQQRVSTLHPAIRLEVADIINGIEEKVFPDTVSVRVVSALRTFKEQDDLYELGRTKPGKIVTNAKGGQSNHNYGLSFDFALLYKHDGGEAILSWNITEDFDHDKQADWMEVVNAFKARGYSWGGDWIKFKDYPHIEKTFGNTLKELQAKHNMKKFIPGTEYVIV